MDRDAGGQGLRVTAPSMRLLAAAKPGIPSGFSPLSITGLQVWLDASDAATITTSGGQITQWTDKSANALAFREDEYTPARPQAPSVTKNGLDVVSSPIGGDRRLTWKGAAASIPLSPYTAFVVGRYPTGGHPYGIAVAAINADSGAQSSQSPNTDFLVRNTDYNPDRAWASCRGVYLNDANVLAPVDTWCIWRVQSNGSTLVADVNGGAAGSVAASSPDNAKNIRVLAGFGAAGFPWNTLNGAYMDIAEILIYNADLDSTDLTAVRNYLNAKWAVYA